MERDERSIGFRASDWTRAELGPDGYGAGMGIGETGTMLEPLRGRSWAGKTVDRSLAFAPPAFLLDPGDTVMVDPHTWDPSDMVVPPPPSNDIHSHHIWSGETEDEWGEPGSVTSGRVEMLELKQGFP